MTKRDLPRADVSVRPGVRTEVPRTVAARWNPDLRAAEHDAATISILDPIGANWLGEGVTAKRVAAALGSIGDRDVAVHVNSPGGDFFEGLAIYNLLNEHPGAVTVKILGLAASAASIVAMAGDDIRIAEAGFLMIHNTWVVASGDRRALREVADWLEPFDAVSAGIYAAQTGLETDEIAAMLDRESWIAGKDAVARGFADALLTSDETAGGDPANDMIHTPLAAARILDVHLSRAGVEPSERRRLSAALKGDLAETAVPPERRPDAAVRAGLHRLLARMNSI